MSRGVPLIEDVLVAMGAGGAGQEKVGRDDATHVGLGRRREERARWPSTFTLHGERRSQRVDDQVPGGGIVPGTQDLHRDHHHRGAAHGHGRERGRAAGTRVHRKGRAGQVRERKRRAQDHESDVGSHDEAIGARGAGEEQHDPEGAPRREECYGSAEIGGRRLPEIAAPLSRQEQQRQAEHGVKGHVHEVGERRIGPRGEVGAVEHQ